MDNSQQVYFLVLALLSEILEESLNLPEPQFAPTLDEGAALRGLPDPSRSSKILPRYELMLPNAHCWLQFPLHVFLSKI